MAEMDRQLTTGLPIWVEADEDVQNYRGESAYSGLFCQDDQLSADLSQVTRSKIECRSSDGIKPVLKKYHSKMI